MDAILATGVSIDYDSRTYWEGCLERRLLITRCDDCGFWIHFPRHICPKCWSERNTAQEPSGRGRVFTVALYADGGGFPVALVDLEEQPGLRMPATIVGIEPAGIVIDMPVRLTWIEWRGIPVPAFAPDRAGGDA